MLCYCISDTSLKMQRNSPLLLLSLNTEKCCVYRPFVKLPGENSRTGILPRLKHYQNPQAQKEASKKASKKPDWKQVFAKPSCSALEERHFLPWSSVCILEGACSFPLCRALRSSCMHQGHTGEHSEVLCMPVPAGSLFCPSILLQGTRLSPPPQLFSQAWPFPSAGTPAPTAH